MKFNIKTKSGRSLHDGTIDRRYIVVSYDHTTEKDEIQFWTWLKYTFPRIDMNKQQKVFGCSYKDFVVIYKEWGNKFDFQS
jgi:hypothetical protein